MKVLWTRGLQEPNSVSFRSNSSVFANSAFIVNFLEWEYIYPFLIFTPILGGKEVIEGSLNTFFLKTQTWYEYWGVLECKGSWKKGEVDGQWEWTWSVQWKVRGITSPEHKIVLGLSGTFILPGVPSVLFVSHLGWLNRLYPSSFPSNLL